MSTAPASVPHHRPWWSLNLGGIIAGTVPAYLSLTPSLLPRPALLQGVVTGLSFLIGYAVGVALWTLARHFITWRATPAQRRGVWIAVIVALVLIVSGLGATALAWQNEVRALVEMPERGAPSVLEFNLGLIPTMLIGLAIGRGIAALYRRFDREQGTLVSVLGVSVACTLTVAIVVGVAMVGVDRVYFAANAEPVAELSAPTAETRSAGPGSEVAWDTVGRHGSAFLGEGPDAAAITAITGLDAEEPIRVYAGLDSAETTSERAALAVRELHRTGAFDRDFLMVATTTGSGWLEPQTVDAFEYVHAGNTAIVSMQYAYTPSWVSFLFNPDAPIEAATVLFDAVAAEIDALPADAHRPKLISYGLSLGAKGSQAGFEDLAEVRERTDAAVYVGTPNNVPLWRELQDARDAGSPEWRPVLDEGREVRWMGVPGETTTETGPWESPRVLYLQHATDPISWLGTELVWQRPAWLTDEQRSPLISSDMHWIPVVTALQVVIDMLMGESVPAKYGHNYGDLLVEAWIATTGDAGLDDAARARVTDLIASYADVQPFGA